MSNTGALSLTPEHQDFFERFKSFWAAPSGPRVAEIIAADAKIHFTGAGTFSGADYIGFMQGMLDANPEMKVRAIDCAGDGERLESSGRRRTSTTESPSPFWASIVFELRRAWRSKSTLSSTLQSFNRQLRETLIRGYFCQSEAGGT